MVILAMGVVSVTLMNGSTIRHPALILATVAAISKGRVVTRVVRSSAGSRAFGDTAAIHRRSAVRMPGVTTSADLAVAGRVVEWRAVIRAATVAVAMVSAAIIMV